MTYYLGATPEAAVKSTTIFFYGPDSVPAQELAAAERKALRVGITRDATTFDGPEPCDAVVVMPDVPGWQRERIVAAYGEKVQGKASELAGLEIENAQPEPIKRSYPNAHPEKHSEAAEPSRQKRLPRVKEPVT